MTVAIQTNLVIFNGDDVAVTFPFPFPVYNAAHIVAYSQDKITLVQTPVPSFVVSGVGDENGGSITLPTPLASTKKIIIARLLPLTQDLDVENQGGFYPNNFEVELDLLEMQIQQLAEKIGRTIAAPLGETFAVLPPPSVRKGNLLGFTNDNNAVPTVDTSQLLFDLLAAILSAGPGIEISASGESITITNSSIQDCWLLEESGGGGGGTSSAEDIRDIIGVALRGLGCEIVIDDPGDTITVDLTQDATAEIIRNVMGVALTQGNLIVITPDDIGNSIEVGINFTTLDERIRFVMGVALVAGSGIGIAVDDPDNTITISVTPNILPIVSNATVTPTFAYDQINITAQAVGLTIANPTGTAVDGHGILIRVRDNGTSRSITYGSKFRTFSDALPAATIVGKTTYIGTIYNLADDTWDVLGVRTQA